MRRIFPLAALALAAGACGGDGRAPTSSGTSRQAGIGESAAKLTVRDLTEGLEPTELARALAGVGVTISNVTYTGADSAAGKFSGGTEIVGFESGIILSTGILRNAIGPNSASGITARNNTAGDAGLDALSGAGNPTEDAAILAFDFVPDGDTITLEYVFASDEYNDYVNTPYNDVFAFYVNGENCALVGEPAVPVTINTINNGNPFGIPPVSNPSLYRNNDFDGVATIDTEMDGLTTVLTCTAAVERGVKNTMRLAIADASDGDYDSNVFLRARSLEARN
jgi:hypothetical protein